MTQPPPSRLADMRALAILAAAVLILPACSNPGSVAAAPGSGASTSSSTSEPQTTDAARAAAQTEFDAYAAGDWKGAWDLWTAEGKNAISRNGYARIHTACQTLTGPTFEITGVRLEAPTVAVVNFKRLVIAGSYQMRYENGRWRYQPKSDDLSDYKLGLDALIAKRKAEGTCGPPALPSMYTAPPPPPPPSMPVR